jgi:hypothetical protein
MTAMWSSNHSTIYRGLPLYLVIANDLSLAMRFTRIDQNVFLMHLARQSNSYNLMHIQESKLRYTYKINSRMVVRCIRACLALAWG